MADAQEDQLDQSLERLTEDWVIFLSIIQACGDTHQEMQKLVQIGLKEILIKTVGSTLPKVSPWVDIVAKLWDARTLARARQCDSS